MKNHQKRRKRIPVLVFSFLTIISILLFIEIIGRIIGLGNPALYSASNEYGYIYAPNQNIWRFGRHIITNEYSMRSLALSADDYMRILLLGDSVVHGGTQNDNTQLASTLLEDSLGHTFNKKIRVLNCAAGGWGPDNEFEYIKKYNHFNASMIFLVVSSHDVYKNTIDPRAVGRNPDMPSRKPLFAITELYKRYLVPRITAYYHMHSHRKEPGWNTSFSSDTINAIPRNAGLDSIVSYSFHNSIPLVVLIHPTLTEVKRNAYDARGKQIISFFDSLKVSYRLELSARPLAANYLDDIHYNKSGQRFLFEQMYPVSESFVSRKMVTDSMSVKQ